MKWFGESWSAPVCESTEHAAVPVGEPCVRCHEAFHETSQGVLMPFYDGERVSMVGYHRLCLLAEMGVDFTVHLLDQGLPLCGFSREVPARWPHKHIWSPLRRDSNCHHCKSEYDRRHVRETSS